MADQKGNTNEPKKNKFNPKEEDESFGGASSSKKKDKEEDDEFDDQEFDEDELEDDEFDEDESDEDVPDGVAVFPLIPEELGIHPLFLAVLHSFVFLEGSEENVVHPEAAEEGLEYLVTYMQRLQGNDLKRLQEDIETLIGYAQEQQWPKDHITFLRNFISENGIKTP